MALPTEVSARQTHIDQPSKFRDRRRHGRVKRCDRRLGIEPLEERLLLADWSGDIPDGTVWPPIGEPPGTVQRIVGNVRVPSGATLTVEPGTVVKFNDFADFLIAVEGTLIADGTAALPIVFTTFADDTGLDGVLGTPDDQDSNGNGPSSGVPSSWQRIEFRAASTGSILDHVDVRFGGENVSSQVLVDGELTLTDSVVRDSATGGIAIMSANPTITGTTFQNNFGAAASMDLASNPAINDVTVAGNGTNGLNVGGGTLAADTTWDDPDIVYHLLTDVTVPTGRTLTIEAGQIIKASFNEPSLIVDGSLVVAGTPVEPVIFTSVQDDSVGGDTLNNGPTSGAGGESGGVRFNPGSTGSVLEHFEVRFAGDPFVRPAVIVDNAELTMRGGAITSSGQIGLRIQNSNPVISGVTFRDNGLSFGLSAVSMDLASNPTIASPTLTNNGVNGLAVDSGTLREDATWDDPDIVYRLSGQFGNVIVPQGRTLTIAPGQIIKAADRVSTEIFVDGTLVADGAPDAPIIFTSHLDDSAGGDTNNNGLSTGQFFDWQSIRFRATSTGNLLEHVEVRFAGANVPAAVTVQGGSLTMRNSLVRGSATHAVAVQSNASATLENNVLVNSASDRGSGISSETGSIVTAVNNTIDGNFRGVSVLTSATGNLRNNLITNSTNAGIFAENLATVNAVFNDVFNPGRPNYLGLTDLTGQSGNISLDPRYFNRANLQFQLQAGSPALDAGTSDFAPTTDFVGNPRFDDPNVINRGGGAMPFFDLGALERQEISSSDVDLATLSVTGPTTANPGDTVAVNWQVRNFGTGTALGPWSDAIYLSDDPVFSVNDRLIGRLQHTGDLGAGQSYDAMTNVTLTGVLPGRNFFVVRTNDLSEVFEGVAVANNAAASSSSIEFATSVLAAGAPFADSFTAAGESRFYRLDVTPGQTLTLTLDSSASSGATELFIRQGALPSRSDFDFSSTAVQPDQELVVPTTAPGTYYVVARSVFGAAATSTFTLTARLAGLGVRRAVPDRGGNAGPVTVAIEGTRFTPDTLVSLVASDGTTITATATQFDDASQFHATFDLAGRATGIYDVRVTEGADTDTADDAFTVVVGAAGHLRTQIIAPDRIRRGVAGVVTIEYENDGGADLVAPLLLVEAENADLRLPGSTSQFTPSIEFLGINLSGPAGVLPPGARGSVKMIFLPNTNADIKFSVSAAIPETPFDWNAAKAALKPADVSADAWDAIFANFVASVGDTAGEYAAALARDATYLSQLGEYVSDEGRLLAFEFARAGNFGAITQQYTLGVMGRGIPDPTDATALIGTDGNVTIRNGGRLRFFFRQRDGSFRGVEGDFAQLTLVNGAVRIREPDGTLLAFQSSGRLDFVEDPNGNRVTSIYESGRLVRIVNSFGDQITYTYNAEGRITQITDAVGRLTTFAYDAAGEHLLSETDPLGTTAYTYVTGQGAAREHAVASMTFPDNSHQFFEYDAQGRLTRTFVDGGANEEVFTYDALGGVTVIDSSGDRTTVLVNDLSQPGLIQDATGRVVRFFYDANHNLVRIEGPDGVNGELGYDALGNPTRAIDSRGQRLDLSYDSGLNRLLSQRDPRGRMTNFTNDARGNLLAITHADGSAERFAYDPAGNLVETVDRRQRSTRITYDAKNLPVREVFADGSFVDYAYDGRRNLTSATDAAGVTTFEYDAADRLTRVAYPNGRSLRFTYDAASRRTRSVDQVGFTVNYAYDSLGRMSELTNGVGGRIVLYTYDTEGRFAREDRGNGTSTVYTYFPDGKVQSIVHRDGNNTILSRFDYTYDELGHVASMATLAGLTTYGYDATGQLTNVNLGGRTITYQYDAVGNRVSVTDDGTTTNYVTNNLNQYTTVGTINFAYDADGNLISKTEPGGTTDYGYDSLGRLVSVISPTENISYEYNSLGNRSATTRNGQRAEYLIDPLGVGNVVGEYDGAGQLIARYVHGDGLVSRVDAVNNAGFFTFDVTGNASQLTDPTGAVLNSYQYLPFGEILNATGTTPNPFTYAGQLGVMAEGSGLYFMRNRFYEPTLGRFLSPDPIGVAGEDVNLYRYVRNDPVNQTDVSGLVPGDPRDLLLNLLGRQGSLNRTLGYLVSNATIARILASSGVSLSGIPGYANYNQWIKPIERVILKLPPTTVRGLIGEFVKDFGDDLASLARFGGRGLRVALRGVGVAGQLYFAWEVGHFVGDGIRKTNFLWIDSIARATAGAVVDTFFAPESVTLGRRGQILKRCQEIGLTIGDVGCKKLLELHGLSQVAPTDPNDIGGPSGFGPQHFITGDGTLPYIILFENKPDATAPAVRVEIKQTLDPDLDWSTFEVGDFGFGDLLVEVPTGRRFYSTRLDLTETIGEYLDVTAGIDLVTGEATWTFTSIDPATGEQATDIDAGFLQPDQDPPEGEGFVNYTIHALPTLATGTTINAQASIRFDVEDVIDTPLYVNTIDAGNPTSSVAALPAQSPPSFTVNWSGSDDASGPTGSGIASFDIFVSDNGGPFQLFRDDTTATSAMFSGERGHTYGFFSVATDNVGFTQPTPTSAQATTTVPTDTTAPTLQNMPTDRTVTATGPAGEAVTYTLPTATDDIDTLPDVSCLPASGSTFVVGMTTVTCTATDDAGNSDSETFQVTVLPPDTTGPTIDRIDLVRDARGKKVLRIVLTFSESLNEAGAETLANYALETRKGSKVKPVALGSVVYAAGTVTLTPVKAIATKKLPTVFLTARATGTLTDASPNLNPLDGDRDGTPGGDFVRSLSQGAILSVVDELLESGELSGRRGLSESFESSLAWFIGRSRI